jgi:hypothetical protein
LLKYDIGSPTFTSQCTICVDGMGCEPTPVVQSNDFADAFSF